MAAKMPDGDMAVRDTKNRAGATLSFSTETWGTFLARVSRG
jgi:hypothetical protein